ncbi:dymeclin-like isoform X2 [Zophobas morio]
MRGLEEESEIFLNNLYEALVNILLIAKRSSKKELSLYIVDLFEILLGGLYFEEKEKNIFLKVLKNLSYKTKKKLIRILLKLTVSKVGHKNSNKFLRGSLQVSQYLFSAFSNNRWLRRDALVTKKDISLTSSRIGPESIQLVFPYGTSNHIKQRFFESSSVLKSCSSATASKWCKAALPPARRPPSCEQQGSSVSYRSGCLLLLLFACDGWVPDDNAAEISFLDCLEALNEEDLKPSFLKKIFFFLVIADETEEHKLLLLYQLIRKNRVVASYIYSRADLDQLILPLLKLLYKAECLQEKTVFLILVVLFLLSEDKTFGSFAHKLNINCADYLSGKVIENISLGGLMVGALAHLYQQTYTISRKYFICECCMATITNLSAKFYQLHSFATDKLLRLFEFLVKRFVHLNGHTLAQQEFSRKENDEALACYDSLFSFLYMLNNTFLCGIQHNPTLLYGVMQKRALFAPLRTLARFHELMQNINTVLDYFSDKVEFLDVDNSSYEIVYSIIQSAANLFPQNLLKDSPVRLYQYYEDPHYFFRLIINKNKELIYWNITSSFKPES